MKRKQHFLRAVQILAPGDSFTFKAAQRVPEESLPVYPGGAALELVVALQKLKPATNYVAPEPECGSSDGQLSMGHALRIQSAHYWLQLGEVDQAILELGALSTKASNHPLAMKARFAVRQAAKKLNEVTVQE